jgi:HAD superfamily hydrolase (TIGR01509 family)
MKIGAGRERLAAMFAEPEWAARYPNAAAENLVGRIHDRKTRVFAAAIEAGQAALRPGVRRLLEAAAAAGVKTGVASTAHKVAVHTVLRVGLGAGLAGKFAAIFSGNDVEQKKPHPEIYRRCLAEMKLSAGEVIVLEDSRVGLESAAAAGVAVAITFNRWTDDQDFSGAALTVDCLGDPGGPACSIRQSRVDLGRPEFVTLEHLERLLE